jgi:hypothetical protein
MLSLIEILLIGPQDLFHILFSQILYDATKNEDEYQRQHEMFLPLSITWKFTFPSSKHRLKFFDKKLERNKQNKMTLE